jgi:hypothetical protein
MIIFISADDDSAKKRVETLLSGAPTVQNDVDCARAALALIPSTASKI